MGSRHIVLNSISDFFVPSSQKEFSNCALIMRVLLPLRSECQGQDVRTPSDRNCGREVRHLIVDQADDGSSPFSSAMRQ